MKWIGLNEIREIYQKFFESKGHLRLPSFPLVPKSDAGLLLVNAGMAPMKPFFTGEEEPPARRVVTCQKCFRTVDIDRAGKTARHCTFFEMLGNFSFGDYFKKEAVAWAWEFVTKVMELPLDRLWVSIYQDDDEAFDIWTGVIGLAPERVVRLGKEDNFWEIGDGTGPCGPCSEIFYDRGADKGCGKPDCAVGCDCDRYIEFWDLVFTQFEGDGSGGYKPLKSPNIDTGLGLERLACIVQGVDTLYDLDTTRSITAKVSELCGAHYGENADHDASLRIITDHIRGSVFLIGDGVLPSNEGRGYVLRRLLRRAARHGRLIGMDKPFLADASDAVVAASGKAYPEISEKHEYIKKIIRLEEERFGRTVDQGLAMLSGLLDSLRASGGDTLSGEDAFKLSDTFGFPFDLTREIALENCVKVDENGYNRLMTEQRSRARAARISQDGQGWQNTGGDALPAVKTEFCGYLETECETSVAAIEVAGGGRGQALSAGERGAVMLLKTPFYAESGGQVGDTGVITTGSAVFMVEDCKKTKDGTPLHIGRVVSGKIEEGDGCRACADKVRRQSIMRNHTAAHLLQSALREVLGGHVSQAGSYVNAERLRFDFTHFTAMSGDEIFAAERLVNHKIMEGLPVEIAEMTFDQAKSLGATALFGEKYGSVVRTVKIGDFSFELCGGTHLKNTGEAGLFKIISESSVASGVRRIEALTGFNILSMIYEQQERIAAASAALKTQPADLPAGAAAAEAEIKSLRGEIDALNARLAEGELRELIQSARDVGGLLLIAGRCPLGAEALRALGDRVRGEMPGAVAVLAGVEGDKINFVAVCGSDAVKRGAHAGNLIKEIAKLASGGGGGRADSASAGGRDISALPAALAAAEELLLKMLK